MNCRIGYILIISLMAACLFGCEKFATITSPAKQAVHSNSALSKQAEQTFWQNLHQGNYDQIPHAIQLLTAAYLENPNDPDLAGFLGFAHIWVVAERQRVKTVDPRIVDHLILAKKYFSDAVYLAPQDARFLGFYGIATLAEGRVFNDQRQQTRGYFILQKAIKEWPQFNYFAAGYPLSLLPSNTKGFNQSVEYQWRNLDFCAHEKVDRSNPNFSKYMKLETTHGPDRACWNSWIAPFNFEGFFLNMGDVLVKKGDWQMAIKIYNNAKLANNYQQWKYRQVLEDRILHAQENVKKFNQIYPFTTIPPEPSIMFNSRFSCMACHQQ